MSLALTQLGLDVYANHLMTINLLIFSYAVTTYVKVQHLILLKLQN